MHYLFALLVLVALLVCTMAQWPYYGTYSHSAYPYAYNYGVYNPSHLTYWK